MSRLTFALPDVTSFLSGNLSGLEKIYIFRLLVYLVNKYSFWKQVLYKFSCKQKGLRYYYAKTYK